MAMIAEYRRRTPEDTLLWKLVRDNLNTFLAEADARAGEGKSLPKYVREESRRFVDCGILAKGFIRLHCSKCKHDEVVAFS